MAYQITMYDYRCRTGRGGPRKGSGRKPSDRPVVHHVRRDHFSKQIGALITVRVRDDVPSLRQLCFIREFQESCRQGCEREGFRLVHYTIMRDHVHLIVETDDNDALGRGMKSLSARIAHAANRAFGRKGKVLAGRYHVKLLESPRQVHHALRYVLLNARKHWKQKTGFAPPVRLDIASSGQWFDGWVGGPRGERTGPPEVAHAKGWLVGHGWKIHGLIRPDAVPGKR